MNPAPEGTLYVLVHGLITFVKRLDGSFHGFFLEMDGHEYLAGSWLNEAPIPAGATLTLSGVTPGDGDFDPAKNLLIRVKNNAVDEAGQGLRRIVLPPPKKVHSLFSKDIAGELSSTDGLSSTVISALTILEYEAPSFSGVTLTTSDGSTFWSPVFRVSNDELTASLHVLNEPRFMQPEEHFTSEFNRSFEFLGHSGISIQNVIKIDRDHKSAPPGLMNLELHDLIVRNDVAAWIAQQLLDAEQSPASSAVGGEPAVCGGGGGFEQFP